MRKFHEEVVYSRVRIQPGTYGGYNGLIDAPRDLWPRETANSGDEFSAASLVHLHRLGFDIDKWRARLFWCVFDGFDIKHGAAIQQHLLLIGTEHYR
mgnify:CR=1